MRKNKKYISDVKNKIVELHKIESGCKKRVKTLKIPISTIRVIIKRFQSTKNVKNLPERGRVSISSYTLKNAGLFFQPKCWVEAAG